MIREIHHRLRFTFHLMTNDRCNYENFSRWKRQGTETMNLTILQLWEEHLKSPVAALTQAPDCQNDAYDCWSGSQSTGPSHWGPLVASLSSGMAAKVVGAKMLQDSQRLECSGEVRAAWRNLFFHIKREPSFLRRAETLMPKMWATQRKKVDLDDSVSFSDQVYLGCTQRAAHVNNTIVMEKQKLFSKLISTSTDIKPKRKIPKIHSLELRHGRSRSRVCWPTLRMCTQDGWPISEGFHT